MKAKKLLPPHRHSGGFTFVEILLAFGVLAVALTIMIPLIKWSITTTHVTQLAVAESLRMDGAITQLEQDLWQADSATVPEAHLLKLQISGRNVSWQIGPGDQLSRSVATPFAATANSEADRCRTWTDIGATAKAEFISDGHAVRLSLWSPGNPARIKTFACETVAITKGQK